MKTIKTTMSRTKYFLLALLVAFSFSCSPEDGEDGAIGPAGANGADGNANVQTITFDASAFSGSNDFVEISQLTADVLTDDAILAYLNDGSFWAPVPCPVDTWGFDHAVDVNLSVGYIEFDYSDGNGASISITAGDLVSGKVIIIESTSTTTAKTSAKQQVRNELAQAGININDYHAVCDYYGIDY